MAMTNVLSNTFGFGGSNVSLLFRSARPTALVAQGSAIISDR
jgi:hypothetical protein